MKPSGSVLIFVVWTVILLSILVAGLGAQGLSALTLMDRLDQRLDASYIARAGVQQAVSLLAEDATPSVDWLSDEWARGADGMAQQPFGRGFFTLELIDEERKLNVNTAPTDILATLLRRVGQVKEDEARVMADAIEDWRDEDHESRPDGAENFYYLGFPDAYESKDGPFENLEELLLVRGMTPAVYARIAPALTVHGAGGLNINTAGRAVLRALGLSEVGVSGILADRAGPDQQEGTPDDHYITATSAITGELAAAVPVTDQARLTQLVQQNLFTVRSEDFQVSVTASVTGAAALPVHVQCVTTRDGIIKTWAEQ